MAYPADLATITHDTPITAARLDYDSAVAAGSHTVEELDVLRALADEADAVITSPVTAPAEPSSPAPPATLAAWRSYIPEHINQAFAPVEGSACACPNNGKVALHVEGCSQGVTGKAQAIDTDFCAEYDLPLNAPIDPGVLGAALRGITVQGLADVMLWEAEDREFAAVLQRGRTPDELEVRAANREAYDRDPAVREAFDRDQAELEAAEDEAEALFETLRKRMSVDAYDAVLDGLELGDADAVLERLRAEVAALPAPSTAPAPIPPAAPAVPPAPVAPAMPLSPEQQLIADAIVERKTEQNTTTAALGPYLTMLPIEDRSNEVGAAMSMTRANRTEAVDAALSGLLSRRGLKLVDLASDSRTSRSAWERLREPEVSGDRYVDGGSFIHSIPDTTPKVWGSGEEVLWAEGEGLIVAGPQGVGKSTLAGNLVAAMITGGEVLGYPVKKVDRILYLAMDRPKQIARALRRQLGGVPESDLAQRLVVWQGPPPEDLAAHPDRLLAMVEKAKADVVIVDSLKDAALGLSSDEVGAGWNRARQTVLAAGIDVLELHHDRKTSDVTAPAIEKLYGSVWITSGAGSVIHLGGEPGDPIVRLSHLKQPASEVGPFQINHDGVTGTMTIHDATDLEAMARQPGGVTVTSAAQALFDVEKPTDAQREKARRKLNKLHDGGKITAGNVGGATVYTAATGLTAVEPPGASTA